MSIQIAIDGPAGAGKSTIARRLAGELGFVYVDTGAMYRAMALFFLRKGIAGEDTRAIEDACAACEVTIAYHDGEQQVLLNGENVNARIRTEEVSRMTSVFSVQPSVREKMTALQRHLAETENVVMDGRDIGTCVLPNADVKIYLTASSRERARRRLEEYRRKGMELSLDEVERDIIERDERDKTRAVSPLRQAEDAVLVDTSTLTIEEVTAKLRALCLAAIGGNQ